jgi:hypothetical protein
VKTLLGVAVCAAAAIVALPSARADSPAPTTVTLSQTPDPSGPPEANYQLIADLAPPQAIGSIVLLDNGHQVTAASYYQSRWSYATTGLTIGTHHLTVEFTPLAGSGYAPSQASIDYTVAGITTSPTPTPTPTATPTPSPTPTTHHTPTPNPTPTDTATPVPAVSGSPGAGGGGSGGTGDSGGGGDGLLPFTGLNAIGMLIAAGTLVVMGTSLIAAARTRRNSRAI